MSGFGLLTIGFLFPLYSILPAWISWNGVEIYNSLSAEVGSMELQEVPLLSDLFSIGQLVACSVRKLELVHEKKGRGKSEDGKNEKKARRIELSLKLNYLYDGLSIDAVHEGQVKLNRSKHIIFSEDINFLFLNSVCACMVFLFVQNLL